ncbi:hypothetical protein DPEC_G00153260 [Dallia pectoralis]|uniref:Uncharacterized protein n=1 Tax=Dallia pectoralis TaxID=75939 RepID=A0ACC2GK74_DALPE|nr:hypothetical protein DPEC_G00153260 [Dallia pectoralis]
MNYQQHLANSAAIRSEIQRFESVHPNIYSIYELLERVEEPILQNQIREHVIAIEASLLQGHAHHHLDYVLKNSGTVRSGPYLEGAG